MRFSLTVQGKRAAENKGRRIKNSATATPSHGFGLLPNHEVVDNGLISIDRFLAQPAEYLLILLGLSAPSHDARCRDQARGCDPPSTPCHLQKSTMYNTNRESRGSDRQRMERTIRVADLLGVLGFVSAS